MVLLRRLSTLELVLDTPKGRGVFATALIPAGTLIDTAPIILLPPNDFTTHITHTTLLHYSYNWPVPCPAPAPAGTTTLHQAIVLGLGSMFNHSAHRQNVGWVRDLAAQVVIYTALKDIAAGAELLISYGPHLTFDDVDARAVAEDEDEDPLAGISCDL